MHLLPLYQTINMEIRYPQTYGDRTIERPKPEDLKKKSTGKGQWNNKKKIDLKTKILIDKLI